MIRFLRVRYLRWKTKNWKREDHIDCLSFLGPCNECQDKIRYDRLVTPIPKAELQ